MTILRLKNLTLRSDRAKKLQELRDIHDECKWFYNNVFQANTIYKWETISNAENLHIPSIIEEMSLEDIVTAIEEYQDVLRKCLEDTKMWLSPDCTWHKLRRIYLKYNLESPAAERFMVRVIEFEKSNELYIKKYWIGPCMPCLRECLELVVFRRLSGIENIDWE